MSEEDVNLNNPNNVRNDLEPRNAVHVTPIPPAAKADDLFDDTAQAALPARPSKPKTDRPSQEENKKMPKSRTFNP